MFCIKITTLNHIFVLLSTDNENVQLMKQTENWEKIFTNSLMIFQI